MKKITWFYMPGCPYCRNADRALRELTEENPEYAKVEIARIDETANAAFADQYDYYYVPSLFFGEEKQYECSPSENYESIREHVKEVLDRAKE